MNYTKGEWKAMFSQLTEMNWIKADHKNICTLNGSDNIDDEISGSEAKANAKLIAAAPDLLAALHDAPILSKFNDAEKFIEAYEKWRDEIKSAALKKATE